MEGHSDPPPSIGMLELGVRALLDNDHPTKALESSDNLSTGDAGQRWHWS